MKLSVNPSCHGKDRYTVGNDKWQVVDKTIEQIIEWQYIEGLAIAPGVFDTSPLQENEKTQKTDVRWLGSKLVVVDVDDASDEDLTTCFADDWITQHLAAAIPSSGHTLDKPKYHFYFMLNKYLDKPNNYRDIAAYVAGKFPIPADNALTRPSQALYGTVFQHESMTGYTKTLNDDLVYINSNCQPLNILSIMQEIVRLRNLTMELNPSGTNKRSSQDRNNPELAPRAELHYQQNDATRLRITLDALNFALKGWGKRSYDEWLALVISAYDGDSGLEICKAIIEHPDINWDNEGRKEFVRWWEKFKPRQGGYTVATLFYMARANGWLQSTSIDLIPDDYTLINTNDVGDWLLEQTSLPRHMLIVSNTGTAKTQGAIRLLIKRGIPKAVFFAPSIKLCTALSATLTRFGVENTLYIDNGNTKDSDTLEAANVLVTTLQTFAIKLVSKGVDLSTYQMAVIDESDELISAFVRAEAGSVMGMGSHVNRLQSQWGMYTLSRIMRDVTQVLLLDGTATKLSLELMQRLCPLDTQPVVYWNEYQRPKAPVTLLPSIYDARKVALDAVSAGLQVVIAADTKKECETIAEYMLHLGIVDKNDLLVITGSTHHDKRVLAFLANVEVGAAEYRVIIYNSAMGSGVSIETVTPDLIVQIATYISSPILAPGKICKF
jgi:hypothetical protein